MLSKQKYLRLLSGKCNQSIKSECTTHYAAERPLSVLHITSDYCH